jgi:putative spermidine/putrescine transport system permease protein
MQASSAIAPAALALDAHAPGALRKALSRAEARRKWRAFALTLPLLVFLLLTLLVPIAALLQRGVENPEVANTLPATIEALHGWDRHEAPNPAAYAALIKDLPLQGTPESIRDQLIDKDARWGEAPFWRAIAKNGARWTPDYLLASVDLQRDALGQVERMPEEQRAFGGILLRTFHISFVVTVLCLLLGYPLAWWLASLPARQANVLMILVLVPFWTSILVRVAAWIVLLQSEGLVNRGLMGLGLIEEPLALLFNRTGVVIAMVHILLPFMVLPLYSVMKSVPPTYLRAAVSLGSSPIAAFFRVYVPQTYPGIGAGALLVFILAIGYYVTPALLGGADDQMLSYYIARYTNVEVNWGMACALGALLLAATLVLYSVYRRFGKAELSLG